MKIPFFAKNIIFLCLPLLVYSESALQQLYDAAGGGANVPMPSNPSGYYNKSAPSAPVQKSTPQKVYHAPSTSTVIGTTIFGALLENVLFDSMDSPDPELLRQQAEQQRLAQEAAAQKAKEDQIKHNTLMRSFKATPSTSTTTEATASSLSFKTTQNGEPTSSSTLSDEALREAASRPFDGGAQHATFSAHWKPVPLGKASVIFPKASVLCQNGKCTWPTKATPVTTALPPTTTVTKTVNLSQLNMPSSPNPQGFITNIMGNIPPKKNTKNYLILNRLSYVAREVGKELFSSIAMTLIESTPLGDKLSLIKDVYDLAVDDMENAHKVAAWLGSSQLDNPPEITSLSEASKPFLLKAMGTAESLEDITELISDTNEVFGLSAKLNAILKDMP